MKLKQIVIFAVVLFLAAGCAWFQSKEEKTANELVKEGMAYYDDGSYTKAIKSFEQLRDWYPFSKYAILAELKIADAHYNLSEYDDAIRAYKEFEQLHPRNEAIPFVLYRIGRSYYNQIDTVDRDQSSTEMAVGALKRLMKQFPDSMYSGFAKGHLRECYESLAGHEFYVGVYYYRMKHYPAALKRFETIIQNYPDMGIHQEALVYIANCEALIRQEEEAADKEDEDASDAVAPSEGETGTTGS